jgi:Zn-dependent oligopeptidase
MSTALQSAVRSSLRGTQLRSLTALQNKVESVRGYQQTTKVSEPQMRALQAAYDAAKASGLPLPPEVAAAATKLGLK